MISLFLILLIFLFLLSNILGGRFHFCTILTFIIILNVYFAQYSGIFYPLSEETVAFVFLCVVLFFLGSISSDALFKRHVNKTTFNKEIYINLKLLNSLSIFSSICAFYLLVHFLILINQYGSLSAYLTSVRFDSFDVGYSISMAGIPSLIRYSASMTYIFGMIYLFLYLDSRFSTRATNKKIFLLVALVLLIFFIIISFLKAGARSSTFIVLLSSLSLYLTYHSKSIAKPIFILMFLFVMFMVMGNMLNYGGENLTLNQIINYFYASTIKYTFGGLVAFDYIFIKDNNIQLPLEGLQRLELFASSILSDIFNIRYDYTPITELPFVDTGVNASLSNMNSNVFTIFGPYYSNFGFSGALISFYLIGFFMGTLQVFKTKSMVFSLLYSFFMPAIFLMSFYDYFSNISVTAIKLLLVLFLLNNRFTLRRIK